MLCYLTRGNRTSASSLFLSFLRKLLTFFQYKLVFQQLLYVYFSIFDERRIICQHSYILLTPDLLEFLFILFLQQTQVSLHVQLKGFNEIWKNSNFHISQFIMSTLHEVATEKIITILL